MNGLRRAGLAVVDFVVGDDWRAALGVVLGIGVTAILATSTLAAWWVLPVAVLVVLGLSVRRAGR
jgi:hypothetical protein